MRVALVLGVGLSGVLAAVASCRTAGGPGVLSDGKHEAYVDLFVYPVGNGVCAVTTLPFHVDVAEKAKLVWQVRPDSGPCVDDVQDFAIAFRQPDDIDPVKPVATGNAFPKHQKTSKLKKLFDANNANENTRKYTVTVTLKNGTVLPEDPELVIWK